jgi:hypothetical protein
MQILLLAGTAVGLGFLGVAVLVSLLKGLRLRTLVLAGVGGAWALAYLGLVAAVSAGSRQQVLPPGQVKRFCGFYLDCHLGVAAGRTRTLPAIGEVRAAGTFYVVTLRIESNARAAMLTPSRLDVELVDGFGNRRSRDLAAEAAWAGAGGNPGRLERAVGPGESYAVDVVFDLPADTPRPPLLSVTEGFPEERIIELFVVGDEDSFLHAPTLLALPRPEPAERAAHEQAEQQGVARLKDPGLPRT